MNMKTLKTSIFAAAAILGSVVSCTSQDDIYKEFIKDGGYIYPAKAANITSETGFQKVTLFWPVPKDPSLRSARVYWDNYTDSLDLNYSDFSDTVSVTITNLADRSYTFDIVNFDKLGNKSIAAEKSATPYGMNWLSTHEERQFKHAWVDGTTATVQLTESTSEMVATKFRYKNLDGEWVEFGPRMTPREVNYKLPNAMRGKYFEFSSGFLPSDGRDTAWMAWSKSTYPIVYPLDTKGWTVTEMDGIAWGGGLNTPDLMFDGVANNPNSRWHCAKGTNFPKILAFDTHAEEGKEPSFKTFSFYEHPTSSGYRYLNNLSIFAGNEPYDANDKNYSANYGTPYINNAKFWRSGAVQSCNRSGEMAPSRYFSVVFTNSYNKYGYLDIWELVVWGYIEADAN